MKEDINMLDDVHKNNFIKNKGIPSFVQIVAAISSHARILINPYKNMKILRIIGSNAVSIFTKET